MKFIFGRKKPKEKTPPATDNVVSEANESKRHSTKRISGKRLSSSSDSEIGRQDSIKSAQKSMGYGYHSRRRGSDTEFVTQASVASSSSQMENLLSKLDSDSLADQTSSNNRMIPISSHIPRKPSTESIYSIKRKGVLVSPTTSAAVAAEVSTSQGYQGLNDEDNFGDEEDGIEDRGNLTDDAIRDIDDLENNQPYLFRIFKYDDTITTFGGSLRTKTSELLFFLSKKVFDADPSQFGLWLYRNGVERLLLPDERPLIIMKRLLEKIGYLSNQDLQQIGREDHSYYFRFIFDKLDKNLATNITFPSFQHIDLRSNNLKKMPQILYKNSLQIQSLNLSHNLMIELSHDFFSNCKNLKELRLSRCELKTIPECVKMLESLTSLDLTSNRIKSVEASKISGLKSLTSLLLSNNRIEVLPTQIGELSNLTFLNLSNNRFTQFPQVVCNIRSLHKLDISFNEIKSLPLAIRHLTNLQQLLLISNSIEGPLPIALSSLVNLQELDLRKNQITNLDAIRSLPKLKLLLCKYNQMTSMPLNFVSLGHLSASKNFITQVPMPKSTILTLTSLNLSFTKLVSLPEALFNKLPNLEDLTLSNNQLVTLPESIGLLSSLQSLKCSSNELSSLSPDIAKLSNLRTLDLHDNNLSVLPTEIWQLRSLSLLNTSSNLLKEFPRPSTALLVSSMPRNRKTASTNSDDLVQPPLSLGLKKLLLGDNRLTDDVFSPLSMFTELRVLNLSYNIIDEIPSGGLVNLACLEELYLSGNQVSTLPAEDMEKLRSLKILYLNGNRLQTLPAELGKLSQLHTLDVGNNTLKYNICNFPYDWNWNWNAGLRYLNLSGNKRLQISHSLSRDTTLSHLNLPTFDNLAQLRVLGVMDVNLNVDTPDETYERRIRKKPLKAPRIRFGIADSLRSIDQADKLWTWDLVVPQFRNKPECSLFALFDGRTSRSGSGSFIAKYLNDNLSQHFENHLIQLENNDKNEDIDRSDLVKSALRKTFLSLNKDLGSIDIIDKGKLGASAVVVYCEDTTLYIANIGDTVAVLCADAGIANVISIRHTPWRTEEIERIRNNKGFISPQGKLNDILKISRGFGHFHLLPLINANPFIKMMQLTQNEEFVILATRSLWEHISYQTAVDVARMGIDNLTMAAQKLRDFAISYGADENIAVMILGINDLFPYLGSINGTSRLVDDGMNTSLGLNPNTDDLGISAIKRAKWRNQGPGSSKLARLGSKAEAPLGNVALVFTDIKNSTYLWETLSDAMRFAVKTHNLSMRRWLASLGGYEVKTEGDAFEAAFPSVTSALLWCLMMQDQLLLLDWPKELLADAEGREILKVGPLTSQVLYRGISVRMGIHWGSPRCELDSVSNRMAYLGHMVKRSDSICTAADGGQICISTEVVKELEAINSRYSLDSPSLPSDLRMLRKIGYVFFDLGEVKLKGLDNPEVLTLVYSKALVGRHEYWLNSKNKAAEPTAITTTVTAPVREIDPQMIKSLAYQCLRLERIASGNLHSKRASRFDCLSSGFLTFDIMNDSTENELKHIANALIGRIERAITSLYLSKFGSVSYDLSSSPLPPAPLSRKVEVSSLVSENVLTSMSEKDQRIVRRLLQLQLPMSISTLSSVQASPFASPPTSTTLQHLTLPTPPPSSPSTSLKRFNFNV